MLIQKSKPKAHRPQHYHGHTIIELRNARTGIRDRVEHDNEFTLGIDHYLQDGGQFNNSPFNNTTWAGQAIYRNLIGGILLFDKEISPVNGVLPTVMPAGVKMVANGSHGVANNGSPTELGSFNSNESSFTENALTYVYDWTTSQGNGDIACVSLTSDNGGYIGYGNSASNAHGGTRTFFLNQSSKQISSDGSISYGRFLKDNFRYSITAHTASNFTYTKKQTFIDHVSLFPSEHTYTVSLPAEMTATGVTSYNSAGRDGKFVIFPSNTTAGKSYVMGIYDVDTDSWQTVAFTMPSGHTNYGSLRGEHASVCDDFIYIWDGTSWNDIGTKINFDGTSARVYYGRMCMQYGEDLLLCFHYESRDDLRTFWVDLKNNTSYYANCLLSNAYYHLKTLGKGQIDTDYYSGSGNNYFYLYRNPLYLATINNLDEPVQKTASQTMKVTYIVTPA